jgi:guanylate kinase
MTKPGFPPQTSGLSERLAPYADFIEERQGQYDEAISSISEALGLELGDHVNRSSAVANATQQSFLNSRAEDTHKRKAVIGVAGPGAVGKGTLMRHLGDNGFSTNINVTTRPVRTNDGVKEQDGVEYYFRTEEEYEQEKADGQYLTTTPRPGRGNYAISKAGLHTAVNSSPDGCLVEENPETLAQLVEALRQDDPELLGVILYVLPPGEHSGREIIEVVERLATRSGENFGQDDLESTCGKRQMDELASMADVIKRGIQVVFLENDDLQEAKDRLSHLFL